MKKISTQKDIDATPDEVWEVLMDFPSHARWDPMVNAISGQPEVGSRLEVKIAMKNGRVMKFRPEVVEYEPGRRFAWHGKLGIRGLFDGLHRFEVEPSGNATKLIHSEEFRGILPPLLGSLLRDTHNIMAEMNKALAEEVALRRETGASLSVARGSRPNGGENARV
jgi:hypothetical protein